MKSLQRKLEERARNPEPHMFPAEAQEFFFLKRVPPGGDALPVERYEAALAYMRRMPRFSTADNKPLPPEEPAQTEVQPLALGSWTSLGPGNIGGRTRALVIDPGDPNVMYAGGVAGGVWKTTNAGASWTPVADLIANLAVNSMAMDLANSNIIYAGTGEGFFNGDRVRGNGIFKSTDAGANWTQLASTTNNSDFFFVNDLIVSPKDSNRIYAATRTGVWRSTNAGTSWSRILNPLTKDPLFPGSTVIGGCLDLALRTDLAADILFAACGTFEQGGIQRTTDAGAMSPAWTEVYTENNMGRTSLAIAPSNQSVVYALMACTGQTSNQSCPTANFDDGLLAVIRSSTGGDAGTWSDRVRNNNATKLNTLLLTNPLFAFLNTCFPGNPNEFFNQGWYDNVIAVDPANSDIVWTGGIDLFRSNDGGANWGLASYWWVSPSSAHADQHTLVFHPNYNGTSNKVLFVGDDGGIYRTDDARAAVSSTAASAACSSGNTMVAWTELNNNYGVTQFYHGVPYPDGSTYFGGTQDNGTLRGNDGAGSESWATIQGGDGGYVAVDPGDTNVLYAEFTGLSLQKSVNGGASFLAATSGITEPSGNFLFIAPFTMDPGNSQRLWTGGSFIWRTTNGAGSWQQASSITAGTGSVSSLAIAPTNANRALVGMSDGIIHRNDAALAAGSSTDWPFVQPRTGFVSWLTFDPTNDLIAYATYSSFNSGGNVGHVFKSVDGGASWANITNNLPDIPAHSVIVDPGNTSRLYVGTDLGVFSSLDGGNSWAVENTGFANVITEALAVTPFSGTPTLFAFTHGRGAWRVPLAVTQNPVPVITSLLPSSAPAGGVGFTLTVNGSNFINDSVVRWKEMDRSTNFVNSGQLTAQIPDTDLTSSGTTQVTVFNPAPGGGTSNPLPLVISLRNPLPTITGLSPPGATGGSSGILLNVFGSNFVFNSTVQWDGTPRSTNFVGSTQLQAVILATDLEAADVGTHQVTVVSPGPGGGTSNGVNFNVLDAANPAPTLTSLMPNSETAGAVRTSLPVMVNGSNFAPDSIVRWNGMNRTTMFTNANQLEVQISAGDLAAAGTASITVSTPAPGGGTSNALPFTINNPAPTLTSISPNSATEGGAAFTMTVLGSNFLPGSVVRWNGSARLTTFIGNNQLRAAIPAGDLASAVPVDVTVFNPMPGGGTSVPQSFTINSPAQASVSTTQAARRSQQTISPEPERVPAVVVPLAPSVPVSVPAISSFQPAFVIAGSGTLTLMVRGENFTEESVVRLKGKDLPTKFIRESELEVELPATAFARPGELKLTVFTPGPSGRTSKPAILQVHAP